jgi:AraC-like DNA-binding protein
MEDPQIRFVLNLLAYAVQKDVSPEQLCRLSGLDLDLLKQKAKVVLTKKQLNDIWLNASHLSNDPLLGLHFGESMQLAALGIVGAIIQSSRTVGEALTNAAAFMQLVTDLFGLEITQANDTFTLRLIPYEAHAKEAPFVFRQMTDLAMVFVLHELDGLLLEKIKPNAVRFPYLEKVDLQEYARVLRCSAIAYANEYAMEFDNRYWNVPVLTANYELQSVLLKKAAEMNEAIESTQKVKEKITSYLLANSYLGIPSLEEIAANFNSSPRSLQRKLQDEGVTYQQLADSVRKSLAVHYLQAGTYPVKEISYILGYNELSAFSRAFKRWTGTSPAQYQKRSVDL